MGFSYKVAHEVRHLVALICRLLMLTLARINFFILFLEFYVVKFCTQNLKCFFFIFDL